ncbi:MAG: AarF/ABC1/UbiB kinase family protein [Anaerolineae bacterium]|nr:AarF/ABC1/UbiB kinase family protein [Anaerolineae bacterium]MCB0223148.1 AarF/ABC1/UbiB kinase family protein [Anaerolineae bacterium]MCB9109536.1 AarF/ABC1/UbiB kinase family protein [Anaerolineales bacterium]
MKRRTSIDSFRENLRLQQVYNVFWRYGMDSLFDKGVLGDFRRYMQEKVYDPPQGVVALSMPVRTRLMLQELGPTYVKMGQIISSRSEVLPKEWQDELAKLQSNVPPFPVEQVRDIIVQELGAPPEELFATFDPEPLAAASTAQVHRATLPDGSEVAIKVQRPNIKNQMQADLGIMRNAARVIQRRSDYAKDIGLVHILDEFGDNVINELDYGIEAYNGRRLGLNMASISGVHIPTIYMPLSTSKILTMEFINGVKITNVEAIQAAGYDLHVIGENFTRGFIKQLMIDGFFHADPHPGNVLVDLTNGEVTFIDIGLAGELDLMERINLISLLMVMQQGDVRGLAQVAMSLSKPLREVDERAYYRDFERTVARYFALEKDAPFADAMGSAFQVLLDHGLRLDPQLTLALKALMQLEAITTKLMPDTSIVPLSYGIAQELVFQNVTSDSIMDAVSKEVVLTLRELMQRAPSLSTALTSWLDQYMSGQFRIHLDTSDLNKELKNTRTIARQIILGIILVGMIIGSAIATSIPVLNEDYYWSLLPVVAFSGYIFSMVVAAVFVIRLIMQLVNQDDEN